KTDQPRVIFFADVERPLKFRWLQAVNRHVSAFMGRITNSPNMESATEKAGFVNRMYALSQRNRERNRAFKKKHPKLFRAGKYLAIAFVLWLIVLAPWPFFAR
ncbi:MAG TPA: lipid A hydroxylase LpxO, partial [Rhodanobacter sp.]|nr:lipid A hydroxylase LpxO [Rhodanobacter sp.]